MRILFIIDSLTSGGKERRLTELIKVLDRDPGVTVEVVVLSNDIHYDAIRESNTRIHKLVRRTQRDPRVFFTFYKLCKKFRPDLIHCWDSMSAIYAIPSCKILGIKLVNGLIVNAPADRGLFDKYILRARLSFLFSDLIIGNSKAGLREYRAPEGKSKVIYNGFDFERVQEFEAGLLKKELNIGTRYVVCMVATFSRFKDYPTYYKAAQKILTYRSDVTFLSIGKKTESESCKSLVSESLRPFFRFLGERKDVESLVEISDLCVLSTFTEGISNSIMEYMALGKAVVATDGGGTNEILIDGVTGYLVKPSDPESLAGKMEQLLNNEDLRLEMGRKGRDQIMHKFTIHRMVEEFIQCYKQVLGNS